MRRPLRSMAFATTFVLAASGQPQPLSEPASISVERILQIAPQVRSAGGYLGVMLMDINPDRAAALKLSEERGVEVTSVEPGSPAENAGIKPGDVLIAYNGENVLGVQQFTRLVQETPPGRRVKIQTWRDGKMQTVTATTAASRAPSVDFPHMIGFPFPDARSFSLAIQDIPNPLLVWKNSLLGIECEPLERQLAEYFGVKGGALVRSVDKGSPADKGGLKAGDVVTAIGDRSVSTPRDLTSYTRTGRLPGRSIAITLMRDHREMTLTVPMNKPE